MIIHSAVSGHTLFVKKIKREELPEVIQLSNSSNSYTDFWVVKNWAENGIVFMYLGRGNKDAPREIVVWYRGGQFWSSYGKTIQAAIEGAQKDGWLYA